MWWIDVYLSTSLQNFCLCVFHFSGKTPQFRSFLGLFEWWSQILPSPKLFRNGFEHIYSTMMTHKLQEKVQQHDEDAESRTLAA